MYKSVVRPLFFKLNAESAHHLANSLLKLPGISSIFKAVYGFSHPTLKRTLFGIDFPNPLGLAAGFDKNAAYMKQMRDLGFGHVEIGTVTPQGQKGNPQPRLFRLPADRALINRMGFNNAGVDATVERLKKRPTGLIVGGNIGKNKITPNEKAADDYIVCFKALFPHVDYFTVNISSPNTPHLRELQDKEPLTELLRAIQLENQLMNPPKPIVLKIAPDLNEHQLTDILQIITDTRFDGIVVSNTTIDRSGLVTPQARVDAIGDGGLSGAPLTQRVHDLVAFVARETAGSLPIISAGGIMSADDALRRLDAGADLLQVYTGFIYEGPALIRDINRAIASR